MIVSVPVSAAGEDPVTGASTNARPRSESCPPSSLAVDGAIVDMSTTSAPGGAALAAPSGPSRTDSTCGPSTTIVITASASRAASAGVAAARVPCSAAQSAAVARVRFHTVTSWPARTSWSAMREPMIPRPMKATRMRRS